MNMTNCRDHRQGKTRKPLAYPLLLVSFLEVQNKSTLEYHVPVKNKDGLKSSSFYQNIHRKRQNRFLAQIDVLLSLVFMINSSVRRLIVQRLQKKEPGLRTGQNRRFLHFTDGMSHIFSIVLLCLLMFFTILRADL